MDRHDRGSETLAPGYTFVQVLIALGLTLVAVFVLFAMIAAYRHLARLTRMEADFVRRYQATQYWTLKDTVAVTSSRPEDSVWYTLPFHFHRSLSRPDEPALVWILAQRPSPAAWLSREVPAAARTLPVIPTAPPAGSGKLLVRMVDPERRQQALAWVKPQSPASWRVLEFLWNRVPTDSRWSADTRLWPSGLMVYRFERQSDGEILVREINGHPMRLMRQIDDCAFEYLPDRIRCQSKIRFIRRPTFVLVWNFPHPYRGRSVLVKGVPSAEP